MLLEKKKLGQTAKKEKGIGDGKKSRVIYKRTLLVGDMERTRIERLFQLDRITKNTSKRGRLRGQVHLYSPNILKLERVAGGGGIQGGELVYSRIDKEKVRTMSINSRERESSNLPETWRTGGKEIDRIP